MNEVINEYLRLAGSFSVLLPIAIGLYLLSKGPIPKVKQLLLLFVGISMLTEIIAYWMGTQGMNNLYLLHVYTIIEFSLITLLFHYGSNGPINRKWTYILIGLFVTFAIVNGALIEGFDRFNANVRAVECLILIALSLLYFYKALKGLHEPKLERSTLFWISVAVAIYFSGNLITFIISNYALVSAEMSHLIWGSHAVLNIIRNVIFAIALWVVPMKLNSPSS